MRRMAKNCDDEMQENCKQCGPQAKMLLQVHDELVFEVLDDDLAALDELVKGVMEHAVTLSIPLVADSNWGKTWYEAK